MPTSSCPKCGASMEPGFLVDHTYGAVAQSEWASGDPSYSRWLGMRMAGRQLYNVTTMRCLRCGLLESYAADQEEPE
jgi:hypothetical protein